jgi:hypothetical protein
MSSVFSLLVDRWSFAGRERTVLMTDGGVRPSAPPVWFEPP